MHDLENAVLLHIWIIYFFHPRVFAHLSVPLDDESFRSTRNNCAWNVYHFLHRARKWRLISAGLSILDGRKSNATERSANEDHNSIQI